MNLHIVILAAGAGTRMKSAQPKVLHCLAGRPLLGHVLHTAQSLTPAQTHVVYGHGGDMVRSEFAGYDLNWVLQDQQLGTGHAVQQAMPAIPDEAHVLVLYGDVPGLQPDTAKELLRAAADGLSILTVHMEDPSGYGRIIRSADGTVQAIVEHKDADPAQLSVQEVNTGFMAAPAKRLRNWLGQLSCNNAQGEYYLTDCVALARADEQMVEAVQTADHMQVQGVNDRVQLADLERRWQRRCAETLMRQGVTLADPHRLDLRGSLKAGEDCFIDVNCVIEGEVQLGAGVRIGPHCVLRNCTLEKGVEVKAFSHIEGAQLGAHCVIGPYARLRPGTKLAEQVRVGNFVETKKAEVGKGSKINHLSYVGDAQLGSGVNVGAGTITCNYDGVNKHQTHIGNDAFIGSNSALVAPVSIGTGATIAAGSTITKDAPENALTVARTKQRSIADWARPQKKLK
nr:bifunctional UDP-N-acetylglucosamine diphosphorylase/glucosamine-1-phosphate N-acetyltransferase GlmU [Oceanococcus sp. HetDA_MAG_MS8]